MKVLITGSHGFIGTPIKNALLANGHDVGTFDKHDGQDITNYGHIAAKIHSWRPEAIIHLAGILGTSELFSMPELAVDTNIKGTLNIFKAIASIQGQDDAEYRPHYVSITMPQIWDNIYQATKNCAQALAEAYGIEYQFTVSHVRAYNVYGPGQKLKPVRKAIPDFCRKSLLGQPHEIYGDGNQYVDLISTDTLAQLFVAIVESGRGGTVSGGHGNGHTVNQVSEAIRYIASQFNGMQQPKPEYVPMRSGEQAGKPPIAGTGQTRDELMRTYNLFDHEDLREAWDHEDELASEGLHKLLEETFNYYASLSQQDLTDRRIPA